MIEADTEILIQFYHRLTLGSCQSKTKKSKADRNQIPERIAMIQIPRSWLRKISVVFPPSLTHPPSQLDSRTSAIARKERSLSSRTLQVRFVLRPSTMCHTASRSEIFGFRPSSFFKKRGVYSVLQLSEDFKQVDIVGPEDELLDERDVSFPIITTRVTS